MKGKEIMLNNPQTTWQNFNKPENLVLPNEPNALYLLNVNTVGTEEVEEVLVKLMPDTVTQQYNPRIVQEAPFGSFSPRNFYVGGSGKTLSFSFTLIEDEHSTTKGNNTKKTLYNLLDRIKGMSAPLYDTVLDEIKPPSVYFQLGQQFAGMGHINSSISYKGVYRDSRYTMADITMVFTFHEQFSSEVGVQKDYLSGYVRPQDITADITFSDPSIEDFIKEQTNYDYLVKQVFADSKLNQFLNVVGVKYVGDGKVEYKKNFGDSSGTGNMFSGTGYDDIDFSNSNKHKYGERQVTAQILNLYVKLEVILSTTNATPRTKYNNFKKLKTEIEETKLKGSVGYGGKVGDKRDKAFMEALESLESIVDNQIKVLSMMGGAGN